MTYRFDKERKNNKSVWIVAGLIFLATVFFWPSIRSFVYKGTEPITKRVFEMTGMAYILPDFVTIYFSSRETLRGETALLRTQIETLENKNVALDLEIRQLRELLGDTSTSSPTFGVPIIASSLASDITKTYATVIFSKGYGDGVEVGDKVYLKGRQIVCSIKEVYARTSRCELYSGFGNKIEGVTATSSVNVTLEGRGGHYIANIMRDTKVEVGERVLLREDQTFVLGEVVEVFNNDQDTSWHLLIRGGYNPVSSSLYYIQKVAE